MSPRLHLCMALAAMLLAFDLPARADSIRFSEPSATQSAADRDVLLKERQAGTTPEGVTTQTLEGLAHSGKAALETTIAAEDGACQGASCPSGASGVASGLSEKLVSPPASQDPTMSIGIGGENR